MAAVLRALRERAGLTQEGLGEHAGLHRTYVGGYERAERRLTLEAVAQVLTALDVSWTEFGGAMDEHLRSAEPPPGAETPRPGKLPGGFFGTPPR